MLSTQSEVADPTSRLVLIHNPMEFPVRTAVAANITLASRSRHPGGVMVALCDVSCRFVSNDVDLATWRALASRAGVETVGDF